MKAMLALALVPLALCAPAHAQRETAGPADLAGIRLAMTALCATCGTLTASSFKLGAQYIGGTGVDTLVQSGTSFNLVLSTNTTGNLVTGFEIVSLLTAGNQTLTMSLADVLEFTSGNTVADTLRITGAAGDILNLQALGKTLSTPAPGTNNLTDVDGTTYNVVASAAGNALTNDVSIGGSTYDVYQYQHGGHTVNLLVNTLITTNVI